MWRADAGDDRGIDYEKNREADVPRSEIVNNLLKSRGLAPRSWRISM